MPRPHARLSDDEIAAHIAELEEARDTNTAAQERHERETGGFSSSTSLRDSHIALVLSREGAAISKAILDLSIEQQLRQDGSWHREE